MTASAAIADKAPGASADKIPVVMTDRTFRGLARHLQGMDDIGVHSLDEHHYQFP